MNKLNQTNNYCQGGSYLSVSRDYAVHQTLDTLESLTNFPFESIDISANPANINRDAKMKVKDAFIPGDTVDVYGCPAAIFCVYNKFTTDNGFEGSIDVVKSLIARGIPHRHYHEYCCQWERTFRDPPSLQIGYP